MSGPLFGLEIVLSVCPNIVQINTQKLYKITVSHFQGRSTFNTYNLCTVMLFWLFELILWSSLLKWFAGHCLESMASYFQGLSIWYLTCSLQDHFDLWPCSYDLYLESLVWSIVWLGNCIWQLFHIFRIHDLNMDHMRWSLWPWNYDLHIENIVWVIVQKPSNHTWQMFHIFVIPLHSVCTVLGYFDFWPLTLKICCSTQKMWSV